MKTTFCNVISTSYANTCKCTQLFVHEAQWDNLSALLKNDPILLLLTNGDVKQSTFFSFLFTTTATFSNEILELFPPLKK